MNIQNKKQLKILTFALIMVVVLGIGYAGITAINLVINGEATASVDQNNFKVKFLSEENVTPTITGGDSKEEIRPIPYTYTHHAYDGTYVTIGQPFSNGERTYSNFAASKNDFGHPASLAHRVSSDNILESYVVFEKDNKLYYLRGGAGNENELAEKPIYTNNVNTLKEAFGPDWESVCSEYSCGENCVSFNCSADGLNANAYADGNVYASGSDWHCNVTDDGRAACNS